MTTINYIPYEESAQWRFLFPISKKESQSRWVSRSLVATHANQRHINCLNNPPLRLNERVRQGISAARGGLPLYVFLSLTFLDALFYSFISSYSSSSSFFLSTLPWHSPSFLLGAIYFRWKCKWTSTLVCHFF